MTLPGTAHRLREWLGASKVTSRKVLHTEGDTKRMTKAEASCVTCGWPTQPASSLQLQPQRHLILEKCPEDTRSTIESSTPTKDGLHHAGPSPFQPHPQHPQTSPVPQAGSPSLARFHPSPWCPQLWVPSSQHCHLYLTSKEIQRVSDLPRVTQRLGELRGPQATALRCNLLSGNYQPMELLVFVVTNSPTSHWGQVAGRVSEQHVRCVIKQRGRGKGQSPL
jgi:hypothetical protein